MTQQPGTRPDASLADARPDAVVPGAPPDSVAPEARRDVGVADTRAADGTPGRAPASTSRQVPWRVAGIAAALAAAVNVLVYLAGESATDGLRAPMGQGGTLTDLPVVAVVLVSVIGILAAAVALGLVRRVLPRRALAVWSSLVAVGLLLSLAPMAQVPAESVPWLVTMHVVVAVVAILVLGRRARQV